MSAGEYFLNNNNMETTYNYFTYFSFFSSSSLWFVFVENELMRLTEVCMFMHKVNQTPTCYNMSERKNVLRCKTVRTGGTLAYSDNWYDPSGRVISQRDLNPRCQRPSKRPMSQTAPFGTDVEQL
jgi:hypothetical protein